MKKTTLLFTMLFVAAISSAETVILKNDQLTVRINSIGAELQSIKANETGREYLWHGDPEYWDGRAPIMFPVVVRFKEHRFTYKDKAYEMPFLGLVHKDELKATFAGQDHATFVLESNAKTMEHYPFPFRFSATYRLEGKALVHEFKVENRGDETLYFALGGHPGFVFPATGGKTRADYQLTFSIPLKTDRPIITDGLIQSERVAFLDNETTLDCDDTRIPDHGMFMKDISNIRIGVAEKGQPPFVEIDFGDFQNVNIWSPPSKPFVCIEPQIGHHDYQSAPLAIEEKPQLVKMPGNTSKTYRFSIRIK